MHAGLTDERNIAARLLARADSQGRGCGEIGCAAIVRDPVTALPCRDPVGLIRHHIVTARLERGGAGIALALVWPCLWSAGSEAGSLGRTGAVARTSAGVSARGTP